MPDTDQPLLAALVQLSEAKPLDATTVASILNVNLKAREAQPNEFFLLYDGKPRPGMDGQIASVDLRTPRPDWEGLKGPFLVMELSAHCTLTGADVKKKFGAPRVEVARPELSKEYVARYIYTLGQGEVSFAVADMAEEKVVSVSIDRTREKK